MFLVRGMADYICIYLNIYIYNYIYVNIDFYMMCNSI